MSSRATPGTDKMHEECGVFGIRGHRDAAALIALGLHALQHRGQEAAGIVTHCDGQFFSHRGPGSVGENFGDEDVIRRLPGESGIGHNRYSTSGDTIARNIQPLFADLALGGFAVAHNGNLTNAIALRQNLVAAGCLFQSTTDTEVIVHLTARQQAKNGRGRCDLGIETGGGRLFTDRTSQRHSDRRKGPPRRPASRSGFAGREPCPRLGNLCPGHHRRQLRTGS